MVAGSVQVEVGDAIIEGQTVSFPVTVTAEQIAILDPVELETMVLGKPVADAKAILDPYGEVADQRLAGLVGVCPELREPGRSDDRAGGPDRDPGAVGVRGPMTRWLGIDLGEKRVGLAVADGDARTRSPGRSRRSGAAATWPRTRPTATVIERERHRRAVVGLPLDVSGDEGPQAVLTRDVG